MELSLDGIGDALSKGLDFAQPFLFGAGVLAGATEALAANNRYAQFGSGALPYRISDAIAQITGVQVAINGYKSGQTFKFNPTGFLNKGLAAAVAAWLYREAKLPYSKEIYKGVFPFAAGYSLGGLFDPPGQTAPGISSMFGGTGTTTPTYQGNVPFIRGEAGSKAQPSLVA